MNNIFPKCAICGENPKNGLFDGIRLANRLICSYCEGSIIASQPDTSEYQSIVNCIKRILYPKAM
ncbi:MAG: hypothetical protein AWM53_01310 [Candidatus Dichloromethanomonas elyunquensis]|nr:MAG: hypothetical protein AWM53_01310 [Candidatus Dichloromethanomonas elyunquensis]